MKRRQDEGRKRSGKARRKPPAKVCGAKLTRRKGTCGHAAGWGTPHPGRGRCKWHGGSTPNHVKKAEREEAEEAVAVYGLPREIEPQAALLEEIHRTAGHVTYCGDRIRELEAAELTFGTFKDSARTIGVAGGDGQQVERRVERRARITALLDLYHRERKHLVDVCRVAIAAGIAERQVRLAEQQGALIAQVIRGVLDDLGVADQEEVPKIVRRHLMLVDGGA